MATGSRIKVQEMRGENLFRRIGQAFSPSKRLPPFLLLISMLGAFAFARSPQQGPLTPPPKREVKRIPIDATSAPPPLPLEEIVRRVSEKESEMIRARNTSAYQISLRIQEFDEKGNADAEFQMTSEVFPASDGKLYEKHTIPTRSALKRLALLPEELADLSRLSPFMLPPAQLADYELTYAGQQALDELTTYALRVNPRRLERSRRLFEGVIWVDDRDFAIVKTYGRMVSEVEQNTELEPFVFFETYRENVEGKYWFPTFMRSEQVLKSQAGEAKLRLTIRYVNYRIGARPAPAPLPR